jgi:hypothetical protein
MRHENGCHTHWADTGPWLHIGTKHARVNVATSRCISHRIGHHACVHWLHLAMMTGQGWSCHTKKAQTKRAERGNLNETGHSDPR